MAFLYRLEMADGASAEPPTLEAAVPNRSIAAAPQRARMFARLPARNSKLLRWPAIAGLGE